MPTLISKLSLIAALAIVALLVVPVLLSSRVPELAPVEGRLPPCGTAAGCVSSEAEDDARRVAPLALPPEIEPEAAFARFLELLEASRDVRVHSRWPPQQHLPPTFAHVEFVSPYLRLREDVALLLDPAGRLVHVRAAPRLGTGDPAPARARVEELRAALAVLRLP